MKIWKEYTFDSAHYLPNVPPGHKCGNMHGHTFRVRVYVDGPVQEESGWVTDFSDIGVVVKPLVKMIDHHLLNDFPGLENPTSENIAFWFWDKLESKLPGLSGVEISETCTTGVLYEG